MRWRLTGGGLALTLALLALGACADDPVTTPGGQPVVYTGTLDQGGQVTETLVLAEPGTIRIELTEARAILIQIPPSGVQPLFTIGVGIGELATGNCSITFGSSLFEGENMTVLVEEETPRCLLIFDDGTLPPDSVIAYTVTVDDVSS